MNIVIFLSLYYVISNLSITFGSTVCLDLADALNDHNSNLDIICTKENGEVVTGRLWREGYTLSGFLTAIASLLQDTEIEQKQYNTNNSLATISGATSRYLLAEINREIIDAYKKYNHLFPSLDTMPKMEFCNAIANKFLIDVSKPYNEITKTIKLMDMKETEITALSFHEVQYVKAIRKLQEFTISANTYLKLYFNFDSMFTNDTVLSFFINKGEDKEYYRFGFTGVKKIDDIYSSHGITLDKYPNLIIAMDSEYRLWVYIEVNGVLSIWGGSYIFKFNEPDKTLTLMVEVKNQSYVLKQLSLASIKYSTYDLTSKSNIVNPLALASSN